MGSMMRWTVPGLLASAMGVATVSHAEEGIRVQVPAVYDPQAPVADSVRRECRIETLIGDHVFQQVSARFAGSSAIADPARSANDRSLNLTILAVRVFRTGLICGPGLASRSHIQPCDTPSVECAVTTSPPYFRGFSALERGQS